ncbi:MAG: Na+ dependent nucleoside transporter, partial [Schleiferiaceae bacterium]|nr:Na+ dependent nucleoside transporter [Schleiferiaceae bacterium]
GQGFVSLLGFSREGADFLFGGLGTADGGFGFIFAFQILPTIIFFSAVTSVLFHFGILQRVVAVFAWLMKRSLKLSGAESVALAANVFVGQTEAPLMIKPYIAKMTRSELLCLMTGGMATIAGAVLATYISYLGDGDPESQAFYARHFLAASVMNAPAAIVAAKILVPETEIVTDTADVVMEKQSNWLDAVSTGTTDGLKMAVNVGVMLLVFTALIALVNGVLGSGLGQLFGINDWLSDITNGRYDSLSLEAIFGLILAPLTWLMGVPWVEATAVGQLLGIKTSLNEFYAYVQLKDLMANGQIVSEKAKILSVYILCGFANFASIGIQVGGIGALAPSRRKDLASLGFKALLAGTIASLFTATLVSLIL